MINDYTVDVML